MKTIIEITDEQHLAMTTKYLREWDTAPAMWFWTSTGFYIEWGPTADEKFRHGNSIQVRKLLAHLLECADAKMCDQLMTECRTLEKRIAAKKRKILAQPNVGDQTRAEDGP